MKKGEIMRKKFKWKAAALIASLIVGWLARGIEVKAFVVEESITNNIIPKPMSYKAGVGKFVFNKDTKIYVKGGNDEETEELLRIADMLKSKISAPTGFNLNVFKGSSTENNTINLETTDGEENKSNEEYRLISNNQNIKITAYTPEGIYRGIQTLIQMMPPEIAKNSLVSGVEWSVAAAEINDRPQYSYRGFMIDVARHFFSVDEIKRQIDHASQYKINRLHLHLSDDQGWRLEIKKYPDLTLIGGSTEVGGGKGGYYTQEQFKDIVKYANDRYIEIIPEFDMPGHTSTILQNWQDSNEAARKKNMMMNISIAGKAYLDMKYNKDTPYGLDWAGYIPVETAYKWDPTDYAPIELVNGIEAPLWTENILNGEQMDYMIYPRLPGYAEIGWTPKDQRNWEEYVIRLRNQGARLANEGINFYRDPSIFK